MARRVRLTIPLRRVNGDAPRVSPGILDRDRDGPFNGSRKSLGPFDRHNRSLSSGQLIQAEIVDFMGAINRNVTVVGAGTDRRAGA